MNVYSSALFYQPSEKSGVVFAYDQDPPLALILIWRVCFRPETKKPPWRAVFRRYSELALFVPGNGSVREAATEYQPSLAANCRTFQAFPHLTRYRWPLPMAINRIRSNWKHVDVVERV